MASSSSFFSDILGSTSYPGGCHIAALEVRGQQNVSNKKCIFNTPASKSACNFAESIIKRKTLRLGHQSTIPLACEVSGARSEHNPPARRVSPLYSCLDNGNKNNFLYISQYVVPIRPAPPRARHEARREQRRDLTSS
jgi:hypothetical protein